LKKKTVRKKFSYRCKQKAKVAKSKKVAVSSRFNKQVLSEFKNLLLEKRDSILEEIKRLSEETLKKSPKDASGNISGYSFHMADVATDTYDREFSFGLASSEQQLLYEIGDALKKIDEGKFGVCEECGGVISKKRLLVVPYARLCISCQEKKEK